MKLILGILALSFSAFAQTGAQGVGAPCQGRPQHTFANVTNSGTTLVVPAAPHNALEQIIRVCKVEFSGPGTMITAKLVGTISAADTALTGTYQLATYSQDWNGQLGTDTAGPGASLGINLASAANVAITVTFYYSVQ